MIAVLAQRAASVSVRVAVRAVAAAMSTNHVVHAMRLSVVRRMMPSVAVIAMPGLRRVADEHGSKSDDGTGEVSESSGHEFRLH